MLAWRFLGLGKQISSTWLPGFHASDYIQLNIQQRVTHFNEEILLFGERKSSVEKGPVSVDNTCSLTLLMSGQPVRNGSYMVLRSAEGFRQLRSDEVLREMNGSKSTPLKRCSASDQWGASKLKSLDLDRIRSYPRKPGKVRLVWVAVAKEWRISLVTVRFWRDFLSPTYSSIF